MSVEMVVFLEGKRMPTPERWAAAIREAGFEMNLDTDFDVVTDSGFRPCTYKEGDAGFEYFYQLTADNAPIPDDIAANIGSRDTAVSFVTHSDLRELMTSVIAAGVLCALTDGILFDTEADTFTSASEAIQWSKTAEIDIAGDLQVA